MQSEYFEALAAKRPYKAAFIKIRYGWSLFAALGLHSILKLLWGNRIGDVGEVNLAVGESSFLTVRLSAPKLPVVAVVFHGRRIDLVSLAFKSDTKYSDIGVSSALTFLFP